MKCILTFLIVFNIIFDHGMADEESESDKSIGTPFIMDGDITNIRDVPYQALVVRKWANRTVFDPYCGGSILTPRHILSAAHCLKDVDPSTLKVMLGLSSLEGMNKGMKKYDIFKIIIHPQYGTPLKFSNDLAVIVLQEFLNMNQDGYIARTVSLPKRSYVGETVIVSGYGMTAPKVLTKELRSVKFPVVGHTKCQEWFPRIDSSMLCAGYVNSTKTIMPGDSGSPLVIKGFFGNFIQLGVASWTMRPEVFGTRLYNVFANVTDATNWIAESMRV